MDEEPKALNQAAFSTIAGRYDNQRFVQIVASRLVELAHLQPGETVLDVATGTGHVALTAAQSVGPHGKVVGFDISAEMLDEARRKAEALRIPNLEWCEGDGEEPPFDDERFDVVLCASGIFFMPNQVKALRGWQRCLKPGGRVLFSTFGPGSSELAEIGRKQLDMLVRGAATKQFGLPDQEQSRTLLAEAGFVDIKVSSERHDYWFRNAEEYWEKEYSHLADRNVWATLPPEQIERFKHGLVSEVAKLSTADGIKRVLAVNFASGRKQNG